MKISLKPKISLVKLISLLHLIKLRAIKIRNKIINLRFLRKAMKDKKMDPPTYHICYKIFDQTFRL